MRVLARPNIMRLVIQLIPDKVYDTIWGILPMVILFTVVMSIVRIVSLLYAKEKINLWNELKTLIYIVYCFILFHLVTTTDFESYSNNFIPFKEMTRYSFSSILFIRNVIGNIVLFIPFGYLITDMIHEKANKTNIFVSAFIVFSSSLTIETIQMYIKRSFDIDDIILNFVGGIIGFLIFKIIHFALKKIPESWPVNLVKLLLFMLALALFVLVFFEYYEVM